MWDVEPVPPRPCWVGGSGLLYLPFIPKYEMERGRPHLPLPLLSFCGDIYQLIGNFFDLFANSNISAKIPIYWLIGILDCGETGCWSGETVKHPNWKQTFHLLRNWMNMGELSSPFSFI